MLKYLISLSIFLVLGTSLYLFKDEIFFLQKITEIQSAEELSGKFISYATKLEGAQRLQLASLKQTEIFEKISKKKVLWDRLKLPDVVVRAEVPVEYFYYLDLNDRWEFTLKDNVLRVRIPPIKNLTPALNLDELKFSVEQGSFLRNEKQVLEELRQTLMGLLNDKARENQILIREVLKKNAEAFIRNWLIRDYGERELIIQIILADEEV